MKNIISRYYIIENNNFHKEIIKCKENSYYRYVFGPNEWYKTTIFRSVIDSKNDFKEVSKDEVKKIIVEQIGEYERLWNMAYNLTIEKHSGQLDKAGAEYILHPIFVANKFIEYDLKIVAIMHDLIEDTDVTSIYLKSMGFPEKIIKAMIAITKNKEEKYFDYINRVKKNNIATKVKIEDLKHNLDSSRYKDKSNINYSLLDRYKKALHILEN